jgi:hypothetical protein
MLWAVYLAAAPSDLDAAVRVANDAGYQAGPGDVNCDEGARQVLGVPDNTMVVGLYFDTQAQATQARAAFEARGHQVAGVAHIKVFCAD